MNFLCNMLKHFELCFACEWSHTHEENVCLTVVFDLNKKICHDVIVQHVQQMKTHVMNALTPLMRLNP